MPLLKTNNNQPASISIWHHNSDCGRLFPSFPTISMATNTS